MVWSSASLCSIEEQLFQCILNLLDPVGGWFARLASIVLIPSCNYGVLSLEQLTSKFSTEFSDVQPAFFELQGTENHFTAGLKGSLSLYKFSFYFLPMLKIEFFQHSHLFFTVWNAVKNAVPQLFSECSRGYLFNDRWKRCNCPSCYSSGSG